MAGAPVPLIGCHHCGSIYRRRPLAHGEVAVCPRCATKLWRYSRLRLDHWLAISLAALILFVTANAYPVANMSVQGMTRQASLLDAVGIIWNQGDYAVAFMTGAAGFGFPLLELVLLTVVLYPLSRGRLPAGFAQTMRLLRWIEPWSMVPVFLLGVLVAVVKLASMAAVGPSAGIYLFGVLSIFLTLLGRLNSSTLWRYAEEAGIAPIHVPADVPGSPFADCHVCGQVQAEPAQAVAPTTAVKPRHEPAWPCMRCGATVHRRKPEHVARTWALLVAATILYFPANFLPVMNIDSLFGDSRHTILGGVIELWTGGSWDIAVIVFIASVVVPLTKIVSLAFLTWSTQTRRSGHLKSRTRLYELVELIGQWSMLDLFVVILLGALADFTGFMQISAGPGAASFGLVVILTMLASMSFDPRRSWDFEPDEARSVLGARAVVPPATTAERRKMRV